MVYKILLHVHSIFRWVFIIALIVSVIFALKNYRSSSKKPQFIYLITLIFSHLQLILGLILYFVSPKVLFQASAMSHPVLRFYLVEHITIMLIAIILITLGYKKWKQFQANGGHKKVLIYYGIAFLLILAGIPWPFRIEGAGWF